MISTSSALLTEQMAAARRMIDAALDRYSDFSVDCPAELREAIRYSLLAPCKRLRPILVLFAAEACGDTWESALPSACAVEMVHTYSLIHDDLPAMDDDDLRRGRPTCHKAFGEAIAILAGDALLALAFEVLAREIHPPAVAARSCAALAEAAGATALVGGQADDLSVEFMVGDLDPWKTFIDAKPAPCFWSRSAWAAMSPGPTPLNNRPWSSSAAKSAWLFKLPTICWMSKGTKRPSANGSAKIQSTVN